MNDNYIGAFTKPMSMPTISFEFHRGFTSHSHWGSYLTSFTPLIILWDTFLIAIAVNTPMLYLRNIKYVLPLRNLYMFKELNKLNKSRTKRRAVRYQILTFRGYLNMPVPKSNLTLFKKYYSYIAPTFYNCLSGYMKFIKTKN